MEVKDIKKDDLLYGIQQFDKEHENIIKRKKKLYCVYIVFIILLFFYLRLFNTKFEFRQLEFAGDDLAICYSTAWFIRVPNEYRNVNVDLVGETSDHNGYFAERCPHVLILEIEEGVKEFDDFIISCFEGGESNLQWLRLPEDIKITKYGFSKWPKRVSFY